MGLDTHKRPMEVRRTLPLPQLSDGQIRNKAPCSRHVLGFCGGGGGRRFPEAQGNLYPKSKNSSDLAYYFSGGVQIHRIKNK